MERLDTALYVANALIRLPFEMLKDELAFRRLGQAAVGNNQPIEVGEQANE